MKKIAAVYEKIDNGWIGYVEELPGTNTQGKTKEGVKEQIGFCPQKRGTVEAGNIANGQSKKRRN